MSQDIFDAIDPADSGTELATILNAFKDAIVSGCTGTSRPTNLQAGGSWIDTTDSTSWIFKIYTGSADVSIFTIDLTNGVASMGQALDTFSVKHVGADTVGAIIQLLKQRIAGGGQVLNGDVVGEVRITGRTDSATNPVVASIVFTATDDMTTSAFGGTLSFKSTPAGSATLTEHMRFINGMIETVLPLKVNSLVIASQNIATSATVAQLDAAKALVEMTGSTATDIQGINSGGVTKTIVIHNRSSAGVTLKHLNGGAVSADQIKLPNGDYVILPDSTATLYYSSADSKWKLLSDFATAGSYKKQSFYGVVQTWTAPTGTNVISLLAFRKQGGLAKNKSTMIDFYGNAYAWGSNVSGQLGVGDVTGRSSPVAVLGGFAFYKIQGFWDGTTVQSSAIGIATNGNAYAWGYNANGQLGVGDVTPRSSPVAILGGLKFLSLYGRGTSAVGLTTSGFAYAWGKNTDGELGVGDVTPRSSPVAVLGGLKFVKIVAGKNVGTSSGHASFIGLTKAGAAYAWGYNANGQLGLGDVIARSSPVAVVGGIVFSQIAQVGQTLGSFVGLDTSGNAYAWGANDQGQLGVGDTTARSSPVAVVGGLKFSKIFTEETSNSATVFGMTSDGTLYAWGYNNNGQLGVGDQVSRSSPVAVLGGLKFKAVVPFQFSTAAITTSGDAYAWGANLSGQLGVGDLLARSSPVAILGGQKFSDLAYNDGPTDAQTVIGITGAGSLYAWGTNTVGSLGDGAATAAESSPIAVVGAFSPDARESVSQIDLTVTPGQTYTIGMGDGGAYFGATPLGRDVHRIDLEYFS